MYYLTGSAELPGSDKFLPEVRASSGGDAKAANGRAQEQPSGQGGHRVDSGEASRLPGGQECPGECNTPSIPQAGGGDRPDGGRFGQPRGGGPAAARRTNGGMAAAGVLLKEAEPGAAEILGLRQGAASVRAGNTPLQIHGGGTTLHPVHRPPPPSPSPCPRLRKRGRPTRAGTLATWRSLPATSHGLDL